MDSASNANVASPHDGKMSKRDFIVKTWQRLGRQRAGQKELRSIQDGLANEYGIGAVDSPAAIARILADEGAELTHPEIIEFDAKWRESEMQKEATKFGPFTEFASDSPLTFEEARKFIDNAEILRQQFLSDNDRAALAQLQQIVADNRHYANSWARDPGLDEATRAEQFEIADWLKVWIQTPKLFADWIALRCRSSDFRKQFSTKKSA